MGNEVSDWFSVPANHNPRSLPFNFSQKTGEPCLGFVDIDGFHGRDVSPLSPKASSYGFSRAHPRGDALAITVNTAEIPLRAETESGMRKLYWFADKTFLGACDAREVLCWKPTPGIYQLTALDDHGRSGSRSVTLR